MPPEEVKKKEDEKAKKAQEEFEESQNIAKRKGVKIFIHGQNFLKSQVSYQCFIRLEFESQVLPCSDWCIQGSACYIQECQEAWL